MLPALYNIAGFYLSWFSDWLLKRPWGWPNGIWNVKHIYQVYCLLDTSFTIEAPYLNIWITLTLIQLWKNYPLIQFCGVRTDPGDNFDLNIILHHGKGDHCAQTFFAVLSRSLYIQVKWRFLSLRCPYEPCKTRWGVKMSEKCPVIVFFAFSYSFELCWH